jgi:hypothetical protein
MIFLANTYATYIHGGFVCFCKKTLVVFVCFCKQTIYHHRILQAFVGVCRKTFFGIVKQSLLEEHFCSSVSFFQNGVFALEPFSCSLLLSLPIGVESFNLHWPFLQT